MSDDNRPGERPPTPREFLAHLRHELRTPVNAILGYSEMLQEDAGDLPPVWREGLATLRHLGRQILDGINDLLGSSRAEAAGEDLRTVLDVARAGLVGPACQVVATCAALFGEAAVHGLGHLGNDLERIRTAGESLQALLDAAAAPPAPGRFSTTIC